jgi:hypothetical protein
MSLLKRFVKTGKRHKSRAKALGALALGSFAIGALAVGALAVGRLAIGSLAVGKGSLASLQVRNLSSDQIKVGDLEVSGSLKLLSPSRIPSRVLAPTRRLSLLLRRVQNRIPIQT